VSIENSVETLVRIK